MDDNSLSGAASPSASSRILKFEFRGDGSEYFKIWIVNILLTVLTLGIYSAWATVRNNRYFYSNFYLDGENFRYLAEPLQILKGRLIAIAALILYMLLSQHYPVVALGLMVALMFAIPYFIIQSLAFHRRMTAFKNVQFRFKATYGEAFMVLFLWPLIGLLTLGILYPLALLKLHQFMVKNSAYGTTKFDFTATYKDYGMIFLVMLGVATMFGLSAWAIAAFAQEIAFISPIILFGLYIGLFLFFMVQVNNLFFNSLAINDHRFSANLTMAGMGKVLLLNAFFMVITFGLYLPAAKVRMTKYIASCMEMSAQGSLEHFAAAEQQNVSAVGEEMGQVFDFAL